MESTQAALNTIEENKNMLKETLNSLMEEKNKMDKLILKVKGFQNHEEIMDKINKELTIKHPHLDVFLQKQFNQLRDKLKLFHPEKDNNKLSEPFGVKRKIENKHRRSFV